MEKISWTDRVRNEEVLEESRRTGISYQKKKKKKKKKKKTNWTDHILRRNCLLRHVIEGKIEGRLEVTGRRGRRRKKFMDCLKERRGFRKLNEEAMALTLWRTRFAKAVDLL